MFEIVFITTSREKLSHARYLCRNYEINIAIQKYYGVGYVEPRIHDREQLLKESLEDAVERWNKNVSSPYSKYFFIEDTSVIIHALSSHDTEYPGVDIKYWMKENDFESVDKLLRTAQNNRKVTVRSDVILKLPRILAERIGTKYKHFSSSTNGAITEKEFSIKTQPYYPWLNDRTFNKWFVPEGCQKPLSALPISLAEKYDFRAGAFQELLNFLLQYEGIAKKSPSIKKNIPHQITFGFSPLLFIICGPTCAGKTTIARFIGDKYNYYHIEASDFMYLSFYENHGMNSSVRIGDYASEALKKNPSIVVDKIIEHLNEIPLFPIVITGFRSPKEIEEFNNKYRGRSQVQVVFVDADISIRYQRNKSRNRYDIHTTKKSFIKTDEQQEKMGVSEIRNYFSANTIINENSINKFYTNFENKYKERLRVLPLNSKESEVNINLHEEKLENQILIALLLNFETGEFFTTTQIASIINNTFYNGKNIKSKNNVSRYFNRMFYAYYEIKKVKIKNKKMYRLSQTGLSRVELLLNF